MKKITEIQIKLLKECYLRTTLQECQRITGLSIPTIIKYARKLNLAVNPNHITPPNYWTREDDSFLINNKDRMTHEEIAEKLGRTKNAVAIRLHHLLSTQPKENRNHALLSPTQIQWLKENYPYRLNSYCAELLEISEEDLKFWADRLELKKWEKSDKPTKKRNKKK